MTTGEQIVAEARKLLGVRFFHTGRDENGLDCAGLILCCWHRLGLTDWDERRYGAGGDADRLWHGLIHFCDPAEGEPQAGDVLLLAIKGHPIHVALATGEGTMIHALEQPGSVVEVPFDAHWRKRLVSVWRWRS